jgi:hypothetical protein
LQSSRGSAHYRVYSVRLCLMGVQMKSEIQLIKETKNGNL